MNFPNLPTAESLSDHPRTVDDLAKALYPDTTFDTALPQEWVDWMQDSGFDPLGQLSGGIPKATL